MCGKLSVWFESGTAAFAYTFEPDWLLPWDILGKFIMVIMVRVNIKFRVECCLYLVRILDGGFC